jgi:hypothetical protein
MQIIGSNSSIVGALLNSPVYGCAAVTAHFFGC